MTVESVVPLAMFISFTEAAALVSNTWFVGSCLFKLLFQVKIPSSIVTFLYFIISLFIVLIGSTTPKFI